MNIFIYKSSEFYLLHSFLYEELTLPKKINSNDNKIIYIVDNKIAGILNIVKLKRTEKENYIYLVDVSHITEPKERILFKEHNKKDFFYEINDDDLIEKITKTTYSFTYYHNFAEELYQTEKNKKKKPIEKVIQPKWTIRENETYKNISEPHLKAQYILKEIPHLIGENIQPFIAKNDKNKLYKGEQLSKNSLNEFPDYNIDKDLKKHLSLIDVIWFQNDKPIKCFEVETTTSVYSGILRCADVLTSIETISTEIYIVTTKSRKNKITKELNRPIFKKIGLSFICKVIFIEDLEKLYDLVKLLNGHIKNTILETITYTYKDFEKQEEEEEYSSLDFYSEEILQ